VVLRSPPEAGNDFDMRRMAKLIDGLDPSDFVAAAAKDRGIVREAFRVAGYRDNERHLRGGECHRL